MMDAYTHTVHVYIHAFVCIWECYVGVPTQNGENTNRINMHGICPKHQ